MDDLAPAVEHRDDVGIDELAARMELVLRAEQDGKFAHVVRPSRGQGPRGRSQVHLLTISSQALGGGAFRIEADEDEIHQVARFRSEGPLDALEVVHEGGSGGSTGEKRPDPTRNRPALPGGVDRSIGPRSGPAAHRGQAEATRSDRSASIIFQGGMVTLRRLPQASTPALVTAFSA